MQGEKDVLTICGEADRRARSRFHQKNVLRKSSLPSEKMVAITEWRASTVNLQAYGGKRNASYLAFALLLAVGLLGISTPSILASPPHTDAAQSLEKDNPTEEYNPLKELVYSSLEEPSLSSAGFHVPSEQASSETIPLDIEPSLQPKDEDNSEANDGMHENDAYNEAIKNHLPNYPTRHTDKIRDANKPSLLANDGENSRTEPLDDTHEYELLPNSDGDAASNIGADIAPNSNHESNPSKHDKNPPTGKNTPLSNISKRQTKFPKLAGLKKPQAKRVILAYRMDGCQQQPLRSNLQTPLSKLSKPNQSFYPPEGLQGRNARDVTINELGKLVNEYVKYKQSTVGSSADFKLAEEHRDNDASIKAQDQEQHQEGAVCVEGEAICKNGGKTKCIGSGKLLCRKGEAICTQGGKALCILRGKSPASLKHERGAELPVQLQTRYLSALQMEVIMKLPEGVNEDELTDIASHLPCVARAYKDINKYYHAEQEIDETMEGEVDDREEKERVVATVGELMGIRAEVEEISILEKNSIERKGVSLHKASGEYSHSRGNQWLKAQDSDHNQHTQATLGPTEGSQLLSDRELHLLSTPEAPDSEEKNPKPNSIGRTLGNLRENRKAEEALPPGHAMNKIEGKATSNCRWKQTDNSLHESGGEEPFDATSLSLAEAVAYSYKQNSGYCRAIPEKCCKKTPDDELFHLQWSLRDDEAWSSTMESAWSMWTGEQAEMTIAVIDNGCDMSHPDLINRRWKNPGEICDDGIDNDGNGYIDDCYGWNFAEENTDTRPGSSGHGTGAASIIASDANNNIGIAGICWGCNIMCLKFISKGQGLVSDQVEAIDYSIKMGARISNNSYGGYGYSDLEYEAIARAQLAGHLFITSAGNTNLNTDFPQNDHTPSTYALDNIISVGAITKSGNKAFYSNYGKKTVHLLAPGSDIQAVEAGGKYKLIAGTSFSAPQVVGVAALLWSAFPHLHYTQVKEALIEGCKQSSRLEEYSACKGTLSATNSMYLAAGKATGNRFSLDKHNS